MKSCLTKSLFNTTSFSGIFTIAKMSGLVTLKRSSRATNNIPLTCLLVDSFAGCVKLPIAQIVPTVTKDIAIMAIILLSKYHVNRMKPFKFLYLLSSLSYLSNVISEFIRKLWEMLYVKSYMLNGCTVREFRPKPKQNVHVLECKVCLALDTVPISNHV